MTKIVDHDQRRLLIAEAALRVIRQMGMKGATVRNVARESGLSLGALRHYFSTQDDLIDYSMRLVKERATARVTELINLDIPLFQKVLRILLELLPTDDNKLAEMEVWFAFTAHYRSNGTVFDAQHDGILDLVGRMVRSMKESGVLRPELDCELEIERLYALIDGIALHAFLDTKRVSYEQIENLVAYHMKSICTEESFS
ncbi:TetR family transcriptional regulator C-terminal domain-containing protein [Paenibacillus sp. J5C_2022]|uniref:TetR/AcrR family transcriptional regulator n=1 Tax=Paenibacillus sp. J5C2022 TaxID=2977129 RepID=UPI0021D18424|nr:TetR family transcriptional regulator C-terminal domain-containing protein [Paenibacillus sp. J5C2022]MCU6711736.1 TetR family transcriptional regulator C-terminal domain-containing protein [Paenibacillus sp. J5C2022]